MGDTDFQLVAVKEQVSQVRHHARWRRRSGSPHRENWADLWPVLPVGAPLPARRSAWWHGRHAPVQRPRGAFCDSASAAPRLRNAGQVASTLLAEAFDLIRRRDYRALRLRSGVAPGSGRSRSPPARLNG